MKLVRGRQGRVVILHILPLQPYKPDLGLLGDPPAGWRRVVVKSATERLATLQRVCRQESVASGVVCLTGFPAGLIIAQARKTGADFIVIGSHGHTAFTTWS